MSANLEDDVECSPACFEHHLKEGVNLFTAKWCGHCKSLVGNRKVAERLTAVDVTKIPYYRHEVEDMSEEEKAIVEQNIAGYPTIIFAKNNPGGPMISKKYVGKRSVEDIDEKFKFFFNKEN